LPPAAVSNVGRGPRRPDSWFFGGWQVPFLDIDGFRFGGYVDPINHISVGGWSSS